MTKKTFVFALIALFAFSLVVVSCGDDDDDGGETKPKDTDVPDAGVEQPSDSDSGNEGPEGTKPAVAYQEDFDAWEGGGELFFMAKPENGSGEYDDNNTMQTIGDHDALYIHELTTSNGDYGFAIEVQFQMVDFIDMTGEDYEISFDILVPATTMDKGGHVQFAFYESATWKPIYSLWYSGSIVPDEWSSISARVSTEAVDADDNPIITYSGFNDEDNPGAWIFDMVRIQLIIDGETAAIDEEVEMYLDNLVVKLAE